MTLAKLKKILKTQVTEDLERDHSIEDATIVVENSFCHLVGFSDKAKALVKEALTYDNQEAILELQQIKFQLGMAFRYKNFKKIAWLKSRTKDLEANLKICWLKGTKFPTGHLLLVKDALPEDSYDIKDLRENNARKVVYKWQGTPLTPRYFQEEMVDIGEEYHRGVFESAVGSGKTFVTQMLVHRMQVPTLIILPSKDLSIQTYDSFCDAFGKDVVELVTTVKKAETKKPIKICTIHTLVSFLKKKQLKPLLADLGMICIDEVHHAGAKSYTDLLPHFNHIYYRFGFSGTFMRNDSRTLDMWGFVSTVLYRYSASQATKEGFLTPLKVHVHEIEGIRCSSYQTEYAKNYCQNRELLIGLSRIFDTVAPNEQVLILVGRKETSGEIIHQYLNSLGISNKYVSGDSDRDDVRVALKEFNAKKIQVLIGSSIIGEGIDIKSTDHLFMCQGGKSEIAVTQAIGRAVRLFPGKKVAHVHDFKFSYTKYLEKHLSRRLDIYKKNFDGEVVC